MTQEQPRYPIMAIQITPGGILLTIVRSIFDRQEILIPPDNADTACTEWLASRPADIKSAVVKQLTKVEIARASRPLKGVN